MNDFIKISELKKNIFERDITVSVIGLGYVGLPLLLRFSEQGFKCIGIDIDKSKIDSLQKGKSYLKSIENNKISTALENRLELYTDFMKIKEADVIIICVPTPLGNHNEPNLSYIKATLSDIKPFMKEYQIVILESTTYPGTSDEEMVPFVTHENFEVGVNYFIGYSPEREDPGNKDYSTKNIPKVVSGSSPKCLELVKLVYDQIVDKTVPVSSMKTAEMTKILENIHRAVNIGLVNELKMVADKMGIDIYEVIEAADTKPFGFSAYYPGPGLGGHCIPIDPFYLTWKAKEVGMNTRFIELAGEINSKMPEYVIQKISFALNEHGMSINNSKIFVLGLAYKKNVDDLRESPSLEIIDMLIKLGAKVEYSDPFFDKIPVTRKHKINLTSKDLNEENLKSSSLVVIATDHDQFDYKLIEKESRLIVDTRGRFQKSKKIIKA